MLALVLIAVVAALYGVSADTDTYYLALIVPAALGISLTEALYTALLPFFTRPTRPTRAQLAAGLRVSVPVSALVTVCYLAVVLAVSPARISVWLSFAPALFAGPVSGVYAAFLTADRRYELAVVRIPFITAVTLVSASLLLPFWKSIAAVAVSVSVGQLASLALLVVRERLLPAPRGEHERASPRLLTPAGPVFLATLVGSPLIVVAERSLATALAVGAITLLVNARGFVLVPAMIPQAIGSGIFPAAAERFKALERDALSRLAALGLRLAALAALVSTIYVVVCRRELVHVALQRGKFDARDASETAKLVAILGPSLLGVSAAAVAAKALFAVGRQRFVAVASGIGVAVYVGAAFGLREAWGLEGLAAAFVVSSLLTGALLAGEVARAVRLPLSRLAVEWLLLPALLAAAFGAACWGAWKPLHGHGGVGGSLLTLSVALVAGIAGLVVAAAALRTEEFRLLRRMGGIGGTSLAAGGRWSFRGKDAGSVRIE